MEVLKLFFLKCLYVFPLVIGSYLMFGFSQTYLYAQDDTSSTQASSQQDSISAFDEAPEFILEDIVVDMDGLKTLDSNVKIYVEKQPEVQTLRKITKDTATYINALNTIYLGKISPLVTDYNKESYDLEKAIAMTKVGKERYTPLLSDTLKFYIIVVFFMLVLWSIPLFKQYMDNDTVTLNRTKLSLHPLIPLSIFSVSCHLAFITDYIASLSSFNDEVFRKNISTPYLYFVILIGIQLLLYLIMSLMIRYAYKPFLTVFNRNNIYVHISLLAATLVVFFLMITNIIVYNPYVFVSLLLGSICLEFLMIGKYLVTHHQLSLIEKINIILLILIIFVSVKLSIVVFAFKQISIL